MNEMLLNHAGERGRLIDPKCKRLIRDFDLVSWKTLATHASFVCIVKGFTPLSSGVSVECEQHAWPAPKRPSPARALVLSRNR